MEKLKIAICDDDPFELQKIKSIVQDYIDIHQAELTVQAFSTGRELLLYTEKYGGFDMVILDIIMDGLNGIALAAKIRERSDSCKIIFLTSSPEFAVESYKVNAFYYLLKGDIKEDVHMLLKKAIDEDLNVEAASIIVKEKGKSTRVALRSIHYVESINHTVCFHIHKNEIIYSFSALNAFEDVLLSDKGFVKCHKSYIVNMGFVKSITTKDFIMDTGVSVPISRNVYQQVKDVYFTYFFNK